MIIWMIVLTISVTAIILSAAMGEPTLHMAMTGIVSMGMALMAIRENTAMRGSGAARSLITASTARYMGLVWLWGALAILVTYMFILQWHEWWQFFLGFAAAGILCLLLAIAIERDSEAGRHDETILSMARYLAIGQLAGMVIGVAGLAIDTSKRFLDVTQPEWAANNIFLFGAIALAAITAHALMNDKPAT